ncbi:MAG: ATP-binding protein [Lawsonibacter sp.]|nr:ATP-binding protein [Lawsonibacter sp.]
MIKLLPKGFFRFLLVSFLTGLLSVLVYAILNTYNAYTQMVVQQQQQHLLITARAVSQNLSLYLSEQLRDIDILTRTPGFLNEFQRYYEEKEDRGLKEYILSYMLSQHRGVSRIYLLDQDGNEIYHYYQYPFLEEFDESLLHLGELSARRQSGMGTVFPISQQHYGFTLSNGIMSGNTYVGTIVTVLDMNELYQQYVAPLDIHDTGGIIVKDANGTIIMHPNPEMLTFNYFQNIKELDTLPQYQSLRHMLEDQYAYEEGTATYCTYSNGIMPAQEEIASFSRMNLGGISWFVSAVVPYSEVIHLVNANMSRFGLLVAAILAVVAASVITIYGLQKNRQKLQIETQYLKDINRTLEELHQSREQVRHYQKLQTIGALAGGIVHEFNNLLTPIMGYSEFLKDRMGPVNEYYEDIDEIYKAGARAKEIVDQILPFSRRETDSSSYCSVSVATVVRDALKMIRIILPSSIRLETDLCDARINVFGSATQLNQVLLNLCSNAYQSMEQDGGVLTVTTRTVTPAELPDGFRPVSDGEYVRIQVSDTGCGIPPEILPHIFDPFFTTKSVSEGTGLGLSVVQNILISHSGFIEAKSVVGEGSSFILYLPATDLPSVGTPAIPVAIRSQPENQSLLLIDDDVHVTRYLKKRLLSKGYQVDAYTDSEEALAAFRKTPGRWNLAIVDDTMPKYKGTALVQKMKRENSSLVVILITGLVERDAVQMQQERLIDEIMIKPLDFEHLLCAIRRLMQARSNGHT